MDLHNEQNILIGTANAASRDVLLKFAIGAAASGQYIVYLTHTPFDYIPAGKATALLSRHRASIVNNIVFMYPQTYNELVERLSSLHTWLKPPSIIIVDSLHAFGAPFVHPSDKDAQQTALVIAMLHDLASVFRTFSTKCLTLLSVNRDSFKSDILKKLVQIYYYTHKYLTTEGDNLLDELNKFI